MLLGGKLPIDAKHSNFETFESTIYLISGSMPSITPGTVKFHMYCLLILNRSSSCVTILGVPGFLKIGFYNQVNVAVLTEGDLLSPQNKIICQVHALKHTDMNSNWLNLLIIFW